MWIIIFINEIRREMDRTSEYKGVVERTNHRSISRRYAGILVDENQLQKLAVNK
jgi:hypothetical protein